jgi:glycine reductase complex component B subunit gamma
MGIPTAHITTMTPVSMMVGSHRVVTGAGICHPVGNMELDPKTEKAMRDSIIEKALEALRTEVTEQQLFSRFIS